MRGLTAEALVAYHEALQLDADRGDAWLRLAILHDQVGKFQEAREFYRKALALMPGNPDIFCNMGYSLYLQQQWRDAEMNLRQAIALAPTHRRAHNNLGFVLARMARSEEALAEFAKGGCGESDARANLAFALTMERNWPEARKQYEAALAADADSATAKKGLQELEVLAAKLAARPTPESRENLSASAEKESISRASYDTPVER
jgi:Flp pilus assembly protein TadD